MKSKSLPSAIAATGCAVLVSLVQACGPTRHAEPPGPPSPPPAAAALPRPSAQPAVVESPSASSEGASPVASGAPAPAAIAPPQGPCPPDMVDVERACIDRYEAPNQQNEQPLLMQTADEAVAWCESRGKRLCNEDEWLRACQGPEGLPYPYGARYQEHACNHDATYRNPNWGLLAKWPAEVSVTEASRLNQSEPSGKRPSCGSTEGVFDLTGNVAEWVVKTRAHAEACLNEEQRGHRFVVQGCSWVKCFRVPHEPACDYVNCAHPSGFRSYEVGFRCCKDPVR